MASSFMIACRTLKQRHGYMIGAADTIGPNDLDSNMNTFVIPHIAYSWGLGEDGA